MSTLVVIHYLKGESASLDHSVENSPQLIPNHLLDIDTCQRRLWLTTQEDFVKRALLGHPLFEQMEIFQGTEAFRFLLQVATGLESQVKGETDIFGQIKVKWKAFEKSDSPLRSPLQLHMQRLFEDTKEIRSLYLRGLGGHSYGSLVRMISKPTAESSIFLVGAGKIISSVAPYFLDFNVSLWNRNSSRALALQSELVESHSEKMTASPLALVESSIEHDLAWQNADQIIIGIPVDKEADRERIRLFNRGGISNRTIVHLGCRKGQGEDWRQLPNFIDLDDLFQLQKEQGKARSLKIQRALKACRDKAVLRSLGGSITVPHGWEDLAIFSS